ncbi:alpha/beta hydrolase [Myxosarcina sp. GI1]|uniref:alpha/beta hydrolase n=1 Tax=Myxosarcina sp. GI1 TaxID=1541065 RepID=UPI000691882C|nr:alpha/beta hydrolase [Myxosarcina sp. GI1]
MQIISWLFSVIGLFLSLWIIVPAPNYFLLPLGVVMPEVSPWLVGINAIALVIAVLQIDGGYLSFVLPVISLLALGLSLRPLIQLPRVNQQFASAMEQALGNNYLDEISEAVKSQMRSQPFILVDMFRGIDSSEVRILRGINFASPDGVELKLNTYRPLSPGKYPGIIIIYGGAWRQGSPNKYERFSCYMAARGYTVIAIDYRHAPKYQFPAQLEDVNTALNYIREQANDLEVDVERLALLGRSAGGHLAMLAAYGSEAIGVKAVVNYYGPTNLVEGYREPPVPDPIDTRKVLENFLGGTPESHLDLYQQASPINYVKPNLPPSLFIYPERDHLVQAKYGRQIYDKLQTTDSLAILLTIPWAEHAFDAVFKGVSNQLALYYTERFIAWALK